MNKINQIKVIGIIIKALDVTDANNHKKEDKIIRYNTERTIEFIE